MTAYQAITIPVPEETNISYQDFVRKYLSAGRPVILKGALNTLPAAQWTPDGLGKQYADKRFTVDGRETRFGNFVEALMDSSVDAPTPYLRNIGLDPDFTELIADLQPGLSYTRSNWRFLPVWPKWYFEDKAAYCQFFLAGPGCGFPFMHVDYPPMDTFSALAHGSKEWLLYAPDQEPYLYSSMRDNSWPVVSSIEDPFNVDFEKYPEFNKAEGFTALQEPGDVIFVPNGWWHTTRSHTPTVTVAWDHLSASCWKKYIAYQMAAPAFNKKHRFYKFLVRSYLTFMGLGLQIRDSLMLPFRADKNHGRII